MSSTHKPTTPRASFHIVAQRKVNRKQQVVLTNDVPGVGKAGELKSVAVGYWRNYLQPQGLAAFANEGILDKIQKQRDAELRAKMEEKAKAQAMATALSTIGKFIIKKKVGEENAIFGSVTATEVVEAIRMQTGRELDKKKMTVPEIKELGSYDCSIKLHAEVVGTFKVIVQKDTTSA